MLLPFSIRIAEWPLFEKDLLIRLAVRVYRGRWSNFVCVLLSHFVLRVGWDM